MERKNDSTLLILIAAGLGIYWFMKKKTEKTVEEKRIEEQIYENNLGYGESGFTGNPIADTYTDTGNVTDVIEIVNKGYDNFIPTDVNFLIKKHEA